MEQKLEGKKVAILVTHGFEQSEFEMPYETLLKEGAQVDVVSLEKGKIKAWKDRNWSDVFEANVAIEDASCENYDALVLPGGVLNADKLRVNDNAVTFAGCFLELGKPIAAICHGPWLLVETGKLEKRRMTSHRSIKTDLINAGAEWYDEEVVVDEGLVTSRGPKDLDAFCKKMVEQIREGIHQHHHH